MKKEYVLLALYKAAKPTEIGNPLIPPEMTLSMAEQLIVNNPSLRFDWVIGRSLKVDLSGDEFDPYLYDRDNGEGVAAKAMPGAMLEGDKINERILASKLDDYDSLITERFHLPKMVDLRGSVKITPISPILPISNYFMISTIDIKSVQDGHSADPTTIDGLKRLLNESINEPASKVSLPIIPAKHASVEVCKSILIDIINLKGLLFLLSTAYATNGRYVPDIDSILNIDVNGIVQVSINRLKYVRLVHLLGVDSIELHIIRFLSENTDVRGLVDKLLAITRRLNEVSLINWFDNTELQDKFYKFWYPYSTLCIQDDTEYNNISNDIFTNAEMALAEHNPGYVGENRDTSPDKVKHRHPNSWYVNMQETLAAASPLARVWLDKETGEYLGRRLDGMPELSGKDTLCSIQVHWPRGKFYHHRAHSYPLTFKEAEEIMDILNNAGGGTTLAKIIRIFPPKQ